MSEVIKVRWLTDNEQNKVAPKTLSSQILNDDGTLFKDTIASSLDTKAEKEDLEALSSQIVSSIESITKSEIDEICGASVYAASEVLL